MSPKIPEIVRQCLEVALNRKAMILLAGTSAAALLLSYLPMPFPALPAIRPYLFLTTGIGLAGTLVHWSFDLEGAMENRKLRKQMEVYLFAPDQDTIGTLMGFLDGGTSVITTWPWAPGIPGLIQAGIIEEPKEAMSDGMRAYVLSNQARCCISRHRDALRKAWTKTP